MATPQPQGIAATQTYLIESNRAASNIDKTAPTEQNARWTTATDFQLKRGDKVSVEMLTVEAGQSATNQTIEFTQQNVKGKNYCDSKIVFEFGFYINNNSRYNTMLPYRVTWTNGAVQEDIPQLPAASDVHHCPTNSPQMPPLSQNIPGASLGFSHSQGQQYDSCYVIDKDGNYNSVLGLGAHPMTSCRFLVISRTDQLSTTYPASTNKGISNFYPPKFPMTKYALCDAKPQTAGGTPTTKLTYVPPKLSPWCMDGHNFEITPGMGVSIDKTTGIVPPVSPAYSGAYGTQTDRRVLGVVKNIWSLSEYYGGEGLGQYENYPQALKTAKEHADVHVGASLFDGNLVIELRDDYIYTAADDFKQHSGIIGFTQIGGWNGNAGRANSAVNGGGGGDGGDGAQVSLWDRKAKGGMNIGSLNWSANWSRQRNFGANAGNWNTWSLSDYYYTTPQEPWMYSNHIKAGHLLKRGGGSVAHPTLGEGWEGTTMRRLGGGIGWEIMRTQTGNLLMQPQEVGDYIRPAAQAAYTGFPAIPNDTLEKRESSIGIETLNMMNYKDNAPYIMVCPSYQGMQVNPNGTALCPDLQPMTCFIVCEATETFEDVNHLADLITSAFHAVNPVTALSGRGSAKVEKKNNCLPYSSNGYFPLMWNNCTQEQPTLWTGAVAPPAYLPNTDSGTFLTAVPEEASYRGPPTTFEYVYNVLRGDIGDSGGGNPYRELYNNVQPVWTGNLVKCLPANGRLGPDLESGAGAPFYYNPSQNKDYLNSGGADVLESQARGTFWWWNGIYGNMGVKDLSKWMAGDRLIKHAETWNLNTEYGFEPSYAPGLVVDQDITSALQNPTANVNCLPQQGGWIVHPQLYAYDSGSVPQTPILGVPCGEGLELNVTGSAGGQITAIRINNGKTGFRYYFQNTNVESYVGGTKGLRLVLRKEDFNGTANAFIVLTEEHFAAGEQRMVANGGGLKPDCGRIVLLNTQVPRLTVSIKNNTPAATTFNATATPVVGDETTDIQSSFRGADIPKHFAIMTNMYYTQNNVDLLKKIIRMNEKYDHTAKDAVNGWEAQNSPSQAHNWYIEFDIGQADDGKQVNDKKGKIQMWNNTDFVAWAYSPLPIGINLLDCPQVDGPNQNAVTNNPTGYNNGVFYNIPLSTSAGNRGDGMIVSVDIQNGQIVHAQLVGIGAGYDNWNPGTASIPQIVATTYGLGTPTGGDWTVDLQIVTDAYFGEFPDAQPGFQNGPYPCNPNQCFDITTSFETVPPPPPPLYLLDTVRGWWLRSPAPMASNGPHPSAFRDEGFIKGFNPTCIDSNRNNEYFINQRSNSRSMCCPAQSVPATGWRDAYQKATRTGIIRVHSRWYSLLDEGGEDGGMKIPDFSYEQNNEGSVAHTSPSMRNFAKVSGNQWYIDPTPSRTANIGAYPYVYTTRDQGYKPGASPTSCRKHFIGFTAFRSYKPKNADITTWELNQFGWGDLFGFSPSFYDNPAIIPTNSDLLKPTNKLQYCEGIAGGAPPSQTTAINPEPAQRWNQNSYVWVGAGNAEMKFDNAANRFKLGGLYTETLLPKLNVVSPEGGGSGPAAIPEIGDQEISLNTDQEAARQMISQVEFTSNPPYKDNLRAGPENWASNTNEDSFHNYKGESPGNPPSTWYVNAYHKNAAGDDLKPEMGLYPTDSYSKKDQNIRDAQTGVFLHKIWLAPEGWEPPPEINLANYHDQTIQFENDPTINMGNLPNTAGGATQVDGTKWIDGTKKNRDTIIENLIEADEDNWRGCLLDKMGFDYHDLIPPHGEQHNRFSEFTYGKTDIAIQSEGVKPLIQNSQADTAANIDMSVWAAPNASGSDPQLNQGTPLFSMGFLNNEDVMIGNLITGEVAASRFPILFACPFYSIISNIVETQFQSNEKSQNVVWLGMKNYNAGQYYYIYASDYTQIVDMDRTLTEVTTEIRNPNTGRLARLSPNSCIVYKIERQITVPVPEIDVFGEDAEAPIKEGAGHNSAELEGMLHYTRDDVAGDVSLKSMEEVLAKDLAKGSEAFETGDARGVLNALEPQLIAEEKRVLEAAKKQIEHSFQQDEYVMDRPKLMKGIYKLVVEKALHEIPVITGGRQLLNPYVIANGIDTVLAEIARAVSVIDGRQDKIKPDRIIKELRSKDVFLGRSGQLVRRRGAIEGKLAGHYTFDEPLLDEVQKVLVSGGGRGGLIPLLQRAVAKKEIGYVHYHGGGGGGDGPNLENKEELYRAAATQKQRQRDLERDRRSVRSGGTREERRKAIAMAKRHVKDLTEGGGYDDSEIASMMRQNINAAQRHPVQYMKDLVESGGGGGDEHGAAAPPPKKKEAYKKGDTLGGYRIHKVEKRTDLQDHSELLDAIDDEKKRGKLVKKRAKVEKNI